MRSKKSCLASDQKNKACWVGLYSARFMLSDRSQAAVRMYFLFLEGGFFERGNIFGGLWVVSGYIVSI